MAKVKKDIKLPRYQAIKKIGQVKPWVGNKIAEARKLGEHRAARAARRWGAPAGVALVVFLLIGSFFLPKNSFQQAKHSLLKNSGDFQAQLVLAEELLANNQFEEAEKMLLLAQNQINLSDNQVLGEQTNPQLEELWQKKYYSDPEDIKKLITAWEKIVSEKPNYRDGYLQLAYLHYKLYENEKAQECLEKAIELDPNYELARELKKILED
ncbi:hypothetical protein KKI19_01420 [Patescibacteria group bacterium]|nr:hypothetical protein [Patescibacteria group bacterium]